VTKKGITTKRRRHFISLLFSPLLSLSDTHTYYLCYSLSLSITLSLTLSPLFGCVYVRPTEGAERKDSTPHSAFSLSLSTHTHTEGGETRGKRAR
jgi:hypothetical protein